jgi:hypothetical protein
MCTTSRRIPAISRTNQKSENGDLIPLDGKDYAVRVIAPITTSLKVGSNRRFQFLDLHWNLLEFGDLWY